VPVLAGKPWLLALTGVGWSALEVLPLVGFELLCGLFCD
jgi:hypothetical protein